MSCGAFAPKLLTKVCTKVSPAAMISGSRCIMPLTRFCIACVPFVINVGSCEAILFASWTIISIPASSTCGINVKSPFMKIVITCAAMSASCPALSAMPWTKLLIRSTPIETTCGA